jgi:hypothetical protein
MAMKFTPPDLTPTQWALLYRLAGTGSLRIGKSRIAMIRYGHRLWPPETVAEVEAATNGVITRHMLCPDFPWEPVQPQPPSPVPDADPAARETA